METYVYYYKTDSTKEPIGRFNALNSIEARDIVMEIKRLPLASVISLFEIQTIEEHENDI